jgi:predicted nucleic acid-binding protein
VWFMDPAAVERAFELMEQYGDHPMDLADASLIVAAGSLCTTKVFTLDHSDFQRYRIRRGHRHIKVDLLG